MSGVTIRIAKQNVFITITSRVLHSARLLIKILLYFFITYMIMFSLHTIFLVRIKPSQSSKDQSERNLVRDRVFKGT